MLGSPERRLAPRRGVAVAIPPTRIARRAALALYALATRVVDSVAPHVAPPAVRDVVTDVVALIRRAVAVVVVLVA